MDVGQTSHHHGSHGDINERFAGSGACFVVFTQAAILPQPGKRPFHHPALRRHLEVRYPSETLAAVQGSATNVLCPFHHLADIAPIGPNDPHVRPLPVDVAHHQPCYVPILERRGLLDVGNTKMMSLSTCAWLQAGQDHYLGSLSAIQVSVAALEKALEKVWSGEQALMTVARRHATGKRRTVPRDMKSSVTRRR